MQNRNGEQKGPQVHAEGGHGDKTRKKIIEQLQSGRASAEPPLESASHHDAAHRLLADREQHDAAEKHSEKTRLSRDVERHRMPGEPT